MTVVYIKNQVKIKKSKMHKKVCCRKCRSQNYKNCLKATQMKNKRNYLEKS